MERVDKPQTNPENDPLPNAVGKFRDARESTIDQRRSRQSGAELPSIQLHDRSFREAQYDKCYDARTPADTRKLADQGS
jgi:hypothetical protein